MVKYWLTEDGKETPITLIDSISDEIFFEDHSKENPNVGKRRVITIEEDLNFIVNFQNNRIKELEEYIKKLENQLKNLSN